jgi:predicted PurR-regulated permease PerM
MELTVSNRTIIRIVLIVAASVLVLRALAYLHSPLIWIFTAFFLALALEPAVDGLSRYMPGRSRALAVLLVLLVAIGLLTFILVALVPPLATELYHLVTNLPNAYRDFVGSNGTVGKLIGQQVSTSSAADALQQFSNQILSFGGSAVGVLRSLFGGIVALITILLLTFFMVLEGPRWSELIWSHVPADKRSRYQPLLRQMHGTVYGYVNGNLLTSLIAAVTFAVLLFLLRAPYAVVLGLLVGVIDLIPMVGATLAAILVVATVLVFKGLGTALIVAAIFIVYQLIENNFLQPLVYSKTLEVSPLIVMLALIIGGSLAGFIGALVAIPAAASAQILLKYYLGARPSKTKA